MYRCPKCHRFGVEYSMYGVLQCIWNDCLYRPFNMEEVLKAKHPIRFHDFIKAIKRKK